MSLDVRRTRELLQAFDFQRLFVEVLGWSQPPSAKPVPFCAAGIEVTRRLIAQLAGAMVLEVSAADGEIPSAAARRAIQKEISQLHHENLIIFVDARRSRSLWYWAKRVEGKTYPREHFFSRDQPGDLFISKIAGLFVDLAELDERGDLPVSQVAQRLKQALDVQRVTKRFYAAYQEQHLEFLELIEGIPREPDRRWYASVLLNRLMFVYFLQKKGFLDGGNVYYLRDKLAASRRTGRDRFFRHFLKALFFEGFAKPEEERSAEARALLGDLKYLNGGLFLPHRLELDHPSIDVPDRAFENLFRLFESYSWNLNDTPEQPDDEISPDVLGYIFEKYINQKAFGAYYTRPEITEYLCEQTIYRLILDRVHAVSERRFESIHELLATLDAPLCRRLLLEILPGLSILDPACGSGAFLVAALKTLINVYAAALGRVEFLHDRNLGEWLKKARREHRSLAYWIKKRVITDNLFGVDLMEEAVEIARLRLFLALVASASSPEELEPLPNIDFNLLAGNSLVGLLHVTDAEFDERQRQGNLFRKGYRALLAEKNRLIETFRHTASYADDLRALREAIDAAKREAIPTLDELLLGEFGTRKIKFEQATWNERAKEPGKPTKRDVALADVEALRPFHWGYEFDQVVGEGSGFDVILTNPPWEVWKPQAKEFFAEHSELVTKNKMTIKEFEKEQAKLLRDPEVRAAWLEYQSRFPHISAYFRSSPQYPHQSALYRDADGKEKKTGTDVNLYKLFLERCFSLLREGGTCGILVPTGLYTDLGAKGLRMMLFEKAQITSLFGLSNERFLFEGVHHSFRICLLTFEKGGRTEQFPAAFRMNPREAIPADRLDAFLHDRAHHVKISVDLVRRLSPSSLSLLEFKSPLDVTIAEKMLRFPLLGEGLAGTWNLRLSNEFHMTNDSHLFRSQPGPRRLPLVEGKMIQQFEVGIEPPRYWISEREGKGRLETTGDGGYDCDRARLAMRRIALSTNSRTLIAAMLQPRCFAAESFHVAKGLSVSLTEQLLLCAVLNSFIVDAYVRRRVAANLNMFHIYEIPVPRLRSGDAEFAPIVTVAARLVCTTREFEGLWRDTIGVPWTPTCGAVEPGDRERLRADLDARMAHLYGLTEEELCHILSTFPLVPEETKDAVVASYRALSPKTADPELASLLIAGEGPHVEFKSTARIDLRTAQRSAEIERAVLRTVAGFLNSEGGSLLLGVADDGAAVGLAADYQTLKKPGRDGFGLFVGDLLLGTLGRDLAAQLGWSLHELDGKDVCRVAIAASPRPVFLREGDDEALYVRAGNSTRRLSTREAIAYEKTRWAPGGRTDVEPGRTQSDLGPLTGKAAPQTAADALALRPLFRQFPPPEPTSAGRRGRRKTTELGSVLAFPAPSVLPGPRLAIGDYTREQLKEHLLAVVGPTWIERDEAVRAAARRLGFRRTGKKIEQALRAALHGALRQRVLEASGSRIRRPG